MEAGEVPRGGAFFHGQDTERGVAGQGLYITFGPYEDTPETHEARAVAIGQEIAEVLRAHGFAVEWNGKASTRVNTGPFEWRRRP
jgi:hypothetical protein